MNKKFILIMLFFTLTVVGFFIFSYLFLGVFSDFKRTQNVSFNAVVYAGVHEGDYNKTGKEVVETRNIFLANGLTCTPILVYYDDVQKVGKPYLKSLGGCSAEKEPPTEVIKILREKNKMRYTFSLKRADQFSIYGQTAVVLRKIWPELVHLSEKGAKFKFPVLQVVHDNGDSDFYVEAENNN
ncbi:MAG TPA: hypothetical protein PLY93_08105 [Turneriella sp.]|nr:hypothetical protein [Turneriella sp.]